ncbi:hypothetical protein G6F61_014977 [Rhizopus arrhizus]|nr:hypothetical protein G6F61_014977 [Rhizopus arrhizus]
MGSARLEPASLATCFRDPPILPSLAPHRPTVPGMTQAAGRMGGARVGGGKSSAAKRAQPIKQRMRCR